MDRRKSLATLLGKAPLYSPPPTTTSLDEYTGAWTIDNAAHLLRRATFGPTKELIQECFENGLSNSIEQLLAPQPTPEHPINYEFEEDPNVAVNETWVDKPYTMGINTTAHRNRSLFGWTINLLLEETFSVQEKMVLFWHNHFGISNVNDPKFKYHTSQLLRSHALGNFKELIKAITIDPSMLRFLNGNANKKQAPNENYARELLELFTIGKGDQIAPGDYSNYTENDIIEIAKILTGWRDRGFRSTEAGQEITSEFISNRHDETTKTLSAHFNNASIDNMGADEYLHLIDIIFEQEEVARFISRKLYRWFIYYDISTETEELVIEPMAQLLIDNNYEIKPVLEALFKSEHFFDILNIGPMIKNPIDFVMSLLKTNYVEFPPASSQSLYYRVPIKVFNLLRVMEMSYYDPPSVAGWKAYYQSPAYYRIWISATSLQLRTQLSNALSTIGLTVNGFTLQIDSLAILNGLSNPSDINTVIDEITHTVFPQPITDSQKDVLKGILIPGLPDYEWTIEYGNYAADPNNPDLAVPMSNKMKLFYLTILSMPEHYLM